MSRLRRTENWDAYCDNLLEVFTKLRDDQPVLYEYTGVKGVFEESKDRFVPRTIEGTIECYRRGMVDRTGLAPRDGEELFRSLTREEAESLMAETKIGLASAFMKMRFKEFGVTLKGWNA